MESHEKGLHNYTDGTTIHRCSLSINGMDGYGTIQYNISIYRYTGLYL